VQSDGSTHVAPSIPQLESALQQLRMQLLIPYSERVNRIRYAPNPLSINLVESMAMTRMRVGWAPKAANAGGEQTADPLGPE
jgi:hypothetical protein